MEMVAVVGPVPLDDELVPVEALVASSSVVLVAALVGSKSVGTNVVASNSVEELMVVLDLVELLPPIAKVELSLLPHIAKVESEAMAAPVAGSDVDATFLSDQKRLRRKAHGLGVSDFSQQVCKNSDSDKECMQWDGMWGRSVGCGG